MTDPVLLAIVGVAGAVLLGLAALRKAGSEAAKAQAEASAAIVAAARDLVGDLKAEVERFQMRLDAAEGRLDVLVQAVGSWEGWAGRAVDLLDRVVGMLTSDQQAHLADDVAEVKRTRPTRHGHER